MLETLTLIYTNSHDVTTDLLVTRIGTDRIFRFNFDLWNEYKIRLSQSDFEIESPSGRHISAANIAKFYWRKPMRRKHLDPHFVQSPRLNYIEEELWYMMRELANGLRAHDQLVLVEPFADLRCGKLVQANAASRYFRIPEFKCVFGSARWLREGRTSIVKSLTSTRIDTDAVFYTTAVNEGELDPQVPWMVQDLIDAEKDVTVALVRDELFAFELDRREFAARTLDWRELATHQVTDSWSAHPLPQHVRDAVFSLMDDLKLQYGRIDFLLKGNEYWFLEVNPNGEWGWLDAEGQHGLLKKVVLETSPDTVIHPLLH